MIPMPLDADELVALHDDMRYGPYLMQPSVQMLDLDHGLISDLSDRVVDGQVDCKLEGKIATRSLSLTLVDPAREVAIDGEDVGDGALFYDKMISAGIRFKGPRLGRWVRIPIFCGPMTNGGRSGYTAQVTAQGKERLATGMVWDAKNVTAGTKKVTAISDALVATGEDPARIQLPDIPGKIPNDILLERTDNEWASVVVPVSASTNRQGLYDGRGDYRLRVWPDDPAVVFTDGNGGTILTHPEVKYDQYAGWNGVWVKGQRKPTGKRVESVLWLPENHPCSPWSRKRGGVPFRMAYVVTNSKVRNQAEADDLAERYLRRLAREIVNVTADVMPNWLLEPGDVIAFRTLELGNIEQVLSEFSLPLLPGVSMSVGATKVLQRPIKNRRNGGRTARPTTPTRHHRSSMKEDRVA
ncbi:MAG: hypothetical protein HOV78_11620 [Hamadaea sp.]|nr:hypothetical protein [Hamadaea sp.]